MVKQTHVPALSAPAEIPLQASSRGNDTILPSLEENERAIVWRHYASLGGVWPAWCCGPAEGATVHAATQNTQAGYSGVAPPGHPAPEGVFALSVQRGADRDHLCLGISPATSGRHVKRQDGTQPAIHENHPYKSFQKREGVPAGERCDFGYALPRLIEDRAARPALWTMNFRLMPRQYRQGIVYSLENRLGGGLEAGR